MITQKAFMAEYNGQKQVIFHRTASDVLEAFDIEDDAMSTVSTNVMLSAKLGYLTDKGEFLTPEEALTHALEAGQISDFAKMIIAVNKATRFQMSYTKI